MKFDIDFLDHFSPPTIINNGTITNINGESVPYTIELGLSKSSINECNEWQVFTNNLILAYIDKNPDVKDYRKAMQNEIMLEDYHWNWSKKAIVYSTIGYNWFFLRTSDGTQSVCLTFHPKESKLQKIDIFYIEYVASAPWNRQSSLYDRRYIGAGTEIIKQIQLYFINILQYSYGFCLHSLPQSRKFYEKIGMYNLPDYNKGNTLFYYEIEKANAISFLEGKNARNR